MTRCTRVERTMRSPRVQASLSAMGVVLTFSAKPSRRALAWAPSTHVVSTFVQDTSPRVRDASRLRDTPSTRVHHSSPRDNEPLATATNHLGNSASHLATSRGRERLDVRRACGRAHDAYAAVQHHLD